MIACLYLASTDAAHGQTGSSAQRRVESEAHETPDRADIQRRIRYRFAIRNPTDELVRDLRVGLYAPVVHTASQRTIGLEASAPYELEVDAVGQQIMTFVIDSLPPYATRMIGIEATLLLTTDPQTALAFNADRYLGPASYIESDHPAIVDLARNLKQADAIATARTIHEWVRDNVTDVGYVRSDRGALYALEHGRGDCSEFAYLFTALSRADGVPSRVMEGYRMREDGVLRPEDLHNWSEFFWEGKWHLVDSHAGEFMGGYSSYIAFRIFGDRFDRKAQLTHRVAHVDSRLDVRMQ